MVIPFCCVTTRILWRRGRRLRSVTTNHMTAYDWRPCLSSYPHWQTGIARGIAGRLTHGEPKNKQEFTYYREPTLFEVTFLSLKLFIFLSRPLKYPTVWVYSCVFISTHKYKVMEFVLAPSLGLCLCEILRWASEPRGSGFDVTKECITRACVVCSLCE